MIDIQQIKQISIRDYLALQGVEPKQQNTRYGLYLSPLREEHSPSFKVDYIQNLWYDFGQGEGGSIIDLVMQLERCDFVQAVRLLNSGESTKVIAPAPSSGSLTVPALRILCDAPLRHPALVGYISSRGITPVVASVYCREVRYEVNGRPFFAIGFRNDAGGWELRSKHFKGGSSPKHITTIDNHADTCIAFEGFMDFLSYLSLKQAERLCIDAGGGAEFGRLSSESDAVSRTASDNSRFLRQRRSWAQSDRRTGTVMLKQYRRGSSVSLSRAK